MALRGSVSPESMVLASSSSAKVRQLFDGAVEVGEHVFAFAGQLEVCFDVAGAAGEFVVVADQGLRGACGRA